MPVMWIVFNALILYNVTVVSGRFHNFRDWMLELRWHSARWVRP